MESLCQPFRNYSNSQTNIVKSVPSHLESGTPRQPRGAAWTAILHNQQTCSIGSGPEHAFPLLLKGKGGCSHQLLGVSAKTGWKGTLGDLCKRKAEDFQVYNPNCLPSEHLECMPNPHGDLWVFLVLLRVMSGVHPGCSRGGLMEIRVFCHVG